VTKKVSVPLHNGMHAVIDEADLPTVSGILWRAVKGRRDTWYACANMTPLYPDGTRRPSYVGMHRLIMDPGFQVPGRSMFIDHRNHDGLLNTRENLRWVTPRESILNRRMTNQLGFRGIRCDIDKKKPFRAVIGVNYQRILGPRRVTPEEAALDYNDLALKHHGAFAMLNDIPQAKEE
jgi:hypothetical protein